MTPAQQAKKLLEELELIGTASIPLQKVIDHLNYKAQLFPASDKTRGVACGINRDAKIVLANSVDPAVEQRYAFAHAIGHIVLHEGGNVIDRYNNLSPKNEEPEEWEANLFADELLMEGNLFLQKWDELNGDISRIANVYGLGKERVQNRAKKLEIV